MTQPELLSSPRSLKDRFLDMAALICSREMSSVKPWAKDSSFYTWEPADQTAFKVPIALKQIVFSHDPRTARVFSVVKSQFHILGDDEMSSEADKSAKGRELVEDLWSLDLFEEFADSYNNHRHDICVNAVDQKELDRQALILEKLVASGSNDFTITEKRYRK